MPSTTAQRHEPRGLYLNNRDDEEANQGLLVWESVVRSEHRGETAKQFASYTLLLMTYKLSLNGDSAPLWDSLAYKG